MATVTATALPAAARRQGAASPLAAQPRVVRATTETMDDEWHTELAARADPDEILFAGHYPGFPIFPGVCLIELARIGAETSAPHGGTARLDTVVSTRFLSPVYPGDDLTVFMSWRRADDRWRCRAQLSSPRGAAAVVVLELSVLTDDPEATT